MMSSNSILCLSTSFSESHVVILGDASRSRQSRILLSCLEASMNHREKDRSFPPLHCPRSSLSATFSPLDALPEQSGPDAERWQPFDEAYERPDCPSGSQTQFLPS